MIPQPKDSPDAADDARAAIPSAPGPERAGGEEPPAPAPEAERATGGEEPGARTGNPPEPTSPEPTRGPGEAEGVPPEADGQPEAEIPPPPAPPLTAPPPPPPPPPPPEVKIPPAPKTVERLPVNLTVGRLVSISVDQLFHEPRGEWEIAFTNAGELGLEYQESTGNLGGTPVKAGELELQLRLSHPGAVGRSKDILTRAIKVTVNPDPDSLWKVLPSNTSDPYHKPDTHDLRVITGDAQLIGTSIRGRSHAHEGLFRDDDMALGLHDPSGWHVLVAADGAGSAKFSRKGSQIACAVSLEKLRGWLDTAGATLEKAVRDTPDGPDTRQLKNLAYLGLAGAAMEARKAIQLEASGATPPAALKDFATTLLLAVARKFPAGWVVLTFAIGDGGIGLLAGDGTPTLMCTPDSGEFSGQTLFLTAGNVFSDASAISKRIHVQVAPDLKALILMTDGITDPKFPTEASLGDRAAWNSFWTDLSSSVDFREDNNGCGAQLLHWISFRSPGNHDDRTIALLLPRPPAGGNA